MAAFCHFPWNWDGLGVFLTVLSEIKLVPVINFYRIRSRISERENFRHRRERDFKELFSSNFQLSIS